MQKNKKILIATGIIVTLLAGGFFYFWYVWVPNEMAKQEAENKLTNTPPPTLFGKDDYKIENRTDGTYVLIDKVGLTAKVPEGWETEKINNSNENNTNYWINLSSPDAEFKDILIKGCGISILSGTSQENYSTIKEKINILKQDPEKSNTIQENYTLSIISINNKEGLKWIGPIRPVAGQSIGIDIPLSNNQVVSFDTVFPPNYQEKCLPIWEEFIKTVTIQ